MKNLFKITIVVLLLISCKDTNQSKAMEGIIDEVTGENVNIDEKYAQLMEKLGTKTLLTNAQLLEAFPKKLGSLKLDTNEGKITSSESVIGTFGDGIIRMEILDAAGANIMGAIIPLKMLEINKITSENNNTFRLSKKEHSGILTFGTDRDKSVGADYESDIRFLYDNRFYITLEGKGMNTDELWDAINIDDFKRFKEFNN